MLNPITPINQLSIRIVDDSDLGYRDILFITDELNCAAQHAAFYLTKLSDPLDNELPAIQHTPAIGVQAHV